MNWKLAILFFLLSALTLPESVQSQHLYFERVTGLSETPSTPIHGFAKDSIGYIWFGSWNGVYRYDGKTFDEFRHKAGDAYSLPNNRIRNLILDQNKCLWLLTFDRQNVKYNYSLNRFEVINDDQVPELVKSLLNSTPNQLNRNIEIKGKSYYLSNHKLIEHDQKTGKNYTYTAQPNKPGGLLDGYITSFFMDNQDIIWLGTRSGDIYKANTYRKPFYIHYLQNSNRENEGYASVRAILKRENELWMGTNNNGIEVYRNHQLVQHHPVYTLLKEEQVRTFLNDRQGNIWIGGINGLGVYNPQTKQYKSIINRDYSSNLSIHSVYALTEKDGIIWVGLYNGLAKITPPNYDIAFYDLENLIQGHSVMDLLWGQNNSLWLATEGNGLIRLSLNSSGEITDTLHLNSAGHISESVFSGDMVYSLYEDDTHNIWAGTTDGLFQVELSDFHITHFSVLNGLPDNYIASVTGDEDQNIWIAHKKGISKLKNSSDTIVNYSIRDGNENWTFLDNSIFNDTFSHNIYFGSRDGYVSFQPSEISVNPFQPKIVLKNLYVNGKLAEPSITSDGNAVLTKTLSQTKVLKLKYPERNFTFEIAALHYENPRDNLLYYQLEGYNDEWMTTRQSQVAFTRVPPGHYQFKVKAVSSDQVSSEIATLPITILPPWYFSTVAILGYIVLMVLFIVLIIRFFFYRERLRNALELERIKAEKQEDLNRQKLEFFTNVSHDLRTPLTLITDPIKQLQKNNATEEKRSEYLKLISRNVDQLTNLINQLLDFRKTESGKLEANYQVDDLVEIIRESLQPFQLKATERNIEFSFHSELSDLVGYVDKDKLTKVVTNLVSNALKYTPDKGTVVITLETQEIPHHFTLSIKDNGVGIDQKSLKKVFEPFNNEGAKPFYGYSSGMGLALTHKLVEIMQGEISMESAPQKGTTVTVELPIKPVEVNQQKVQSASKSIEKTSKPLVLIVEDSLEIQSYLENELANEYEILTEPNGLNGLKTALKRVPDLVISDVMMPKMDGLTLCDKLKNNEQTSHIPVILLTAKTSEESQLEGLKTGADIYLPKPFNLDILKAQIQSLLDNRLRAQNRSASTKYVSELSQGENQQDNAFVQKTIEAIKKHVENPALNPDVLAEELHLSRRQLYRKLEAVSGSTVQDFIIRVRMEKASEMLLKTDLNVSQIADKLGFSEASNFSRTFTKHFGQSPTKFRKAHTS